MDREQRISCFASANPRRGQAGTGLRSRSLPLLRRGSGAASRGRGLGRNAGRGRGRGRESITHASHPCAERVPKALLAVALFRPRRERPAQPRARVGLQVPGPNSSYRAGASRAEGGVRGCGGGPLSSLSPLPPHLSSPAYNLRPSIPDLRGTGPGTGRRRERYQEARRHRPVGAGARGANRWRRAAALPGGAEPRPRSAAARRLPLGSRGPSRRAIYKCKGLIVVLCPRDTIVYLPPGRPAFSLGLRRALPSPPPRTWSPEQTRICHCLGAHGLPHRLECPSSGSRFPSIENTKACRKSPDFAWSFRGLGKSEALTPPGLNHISSPTRVNFCARWPKTPSGNRHSFLLR